MTPREAFFAYRARLQRRSAAIPRMLHRVTTAFAIAWAGIFFLAASLRVLASPAVMHGARDWLEILLPYALIAIAPLGGYLLGLPYPRHAPGDPLLPFSRERAWRRLSPQEAKRNPLFGPAGFMASLLIGLLLNVVLRSFEFLLAVPALNGHAPAWGQEMFLLMAADVAVMSFFYMVCFAMALKTIPLFPKMLAFTWFLDVFIQLLIAHRLGAMPALPSAVREPLGSLLEGNIYKVLISAFVWLPYLLLSDRVNLTYRRRLPRRPE